jgi:L-ascorbate metabolism protein UlaG (beta-lactamase superfamily)
MHPWLSLKTALLSTALALSTSAQAQVPAPATPTAGKVTVQWLGQAAFKITSANGKVIVIDPWLTSNPKTPEPFKKLEALGKVDLVLVTHGHFDHMADAPALTKLNNAPLYAPAGLVQSFQLLGMVPTNLSNHINRSGTVQPLGAGITVTLTHAEHSSELVWHNPASDKDELHVGGEPGGFLIEFENGFKVWHMGDTGVFGDMKFIADYYKPDLVLMPIGGGPFVMNPTDAAYATRELIHAKAVIPMHYGTNPMLPGTTAQYTKALGAASTKVLAINPGDDLEF